MSRGRPSCNRNKPRNWQNRSTPRPNPQPALPWPREEKPCQYRGKWRKTGRSGIVEAMQQSSPIAQDLVLVGGGHAHVHVLKRFGMRPVPGIRLTLITRDVETPYSGMLPGYVAGLYSFAECHIDLVRLARFAGARLIHDEAIGLDRAERRVLCRAHPPIRYDLLSLDIGSTPRLRDVPGAAQHT